MLKSVNSQLDKYTTSNSDCGETDTESQFLCDSAVDEDSKTSQSYGWLLVSNHMESLVHKLGILIWKAYSSCQSLSYKKQGGAREPRSHHMEHSGIHLFPLSTIDIANQWVQLITSQWILTHAGVGYWYIVLPDTIKSLLTAHIPQPRIRPAHPSQWIPIHMGMRYWYIIPQDGRHSLMLINNTLPWTPYQASSPSQPQVGSLLHKRSASPGENLKPKLSLCRLAPTWRIRGKWALVSLGQGDREVRKSDLIGTIGAEEFLPYPQNNFSLNAFLRQFCLNKVVFFFLISFRPLEKRNPMRQSALQDFRPFVARNEQYEVVLRENQGHH